MDLRDPPARCVPRIDARFGLAGAESISALVSAGGWPADSVVRQRLATGRRCFAAWVRDEIAAYCWVSRRSEYVGEHEREIRLQPDEAYIWDCATLPPYRGQHLYSALLSYMAAALHEEGVRRVWIGSNLSNPASLRGFANAGFQPIVTVESVRLGSLRCVWIAAQSHAPPEAVAAARHMWLRDDERRWGPFAVRLSRPASRAPRVEGEGHS
jgi:ribosomal protein S18 acetylase RimI-like enzyme